jgi:hypothetical protein
MGPGGALSSQERDKYLKNAVGAGSIEAQVGPSNASLEKLGVSAPSTKALQGVNQYYDNSRGVV